ncbi:SELENOF [Cordylochernes scorpioides]|uniref:Selenoprotein F n=1 Tax=Cordylochernes scorpioides TaxID=51811 RepID=A0ABY6KS53_9ARAC|nr:SELENOF [Cordylochernes scorpioides]
MQQVTVIGTELSAEQCSSLGFRKADLQCSRCDQLGQFDLVSLQPDCRQCCQDSAQKDPIRMYSAARLEVSSFVRSERPGQFPGLTIKYARGADPVIKLLGSSGDVEEELNIQNWDTDTITDFLTQHLH